MQHGFSMLQVYAWRRGDDGPYFLITPTTLNEGIAFAETARQDCRRGFVRFEIHDVRENAVVWRNDQQ